MQKSHHIKLRILKVITYAMG